MRSFVYFLLPACMLMTLLVSGIQAEQFSPSTGTVKGRQPVATPSTSGTIAVGKTLTAITGFTDADVDTEDGTTFSWDIGRLNLGKEQTLYVPALAGANTITLSVTPKTSTAITDPAVGTVSTKNVDVPAYLGEFIKPDTVRRTWPDADAYCKQLNVPARLPTKDELLALFLSATSATNTTGAGQANSDMCSVHNWPLYQECGGSLNGYWSSTTGGVDKYYVGLYDGDEGTYDAVEGQLHVACVFDG
jgi:hypothetical protein